MKQLLATCIQEAGFSKQGTALQYSGGDDHSKGNLVTPKRQKLALIAPTILYITISTYCTKLIIGTVKMDRNIAQKNVLKC